MRIRTIKNCVKDGVHSIVRNGLMSVASIGTISACLFILGITYCIVMNAQQFVRNLDSSLGIVAFLQPDVAEADAVAYAAELQARDSVKKATYISPEEAWNTFKNSLQDGINEDLLAELDNDNPLSNSANIEIYMANSKAQKELVKELQSNDMIRLVRYSKKAADLMGSFSRFTTYVGLALMVVLMLIAVLLIANTIELSVYIRRREINIMKYIGAKDSFIRLPFVVEGMLLGFLGVIIPSAVIYFGYQYFVKIATENFTSMSYLINFVDINTLMKGLLPVFVVLGVVVGMIGSLVSIRKHLKV
ncbi:MAG: permease-like cell division protein FtsX [Clostridiales bacterium]|nr:permease-like cell division protein FtsX [Clostridiales bacterium]